MKEIFDQLEEQSIAATGGIPASVKKDLNDNIKLINFVSNCLELYIPKMIAVAGMMAGGSESKNISEKKLNNLTINDLE